MLLYKYDPITKEYLETIEAVKDRVASRKTNTDVYFKVFNTTTIKPPVVKECEVALFCNNKWIVKEDYRGKVLYSLLDKEDIICNEIGSLPEGYSLKAPERLDSLKAQYINTMKYNFQLFLNNNKVEIPKLNLYFSYTSLERLKNEQQLGIFISRDDNNQTYSLTTEDYDKIIDYLVVYGQYMYLQKWTVESLIQHCQNAEILRTHCKDLEFSINPKLINNIVKMSQQKRQDYFTHMFEKIKG